MGNYGNLQALNTIRLDKIWRTVNESEELILSLTLKLRDINKSVMNLQLPGKESLEIFDKQVTVQDITEGPSLFDEFFPNVSVGLRKWHVENKLRTLPLAKVNLWETFLKNVAYFEDANFKIKKGHFLNEQHDDYESIVLFSGTAHMNSGQINAIKARLMVRWKKQSSASDGSAQWKIYDWRTESFKTIETDQKLFTEVLDQSINNPKVLKRARQSIHERYIVQMVLDPEHFKKPHKAFISRSLSRHPGVAVVDLDRDGYDDFYVMGQWGENMFFHNRGDGTFEEIARDLGLNIKDHTSSAIFADFDNDGDADVILGRTLARSKYLVNENGHFVDRTESFINGPLPYLVSSVSAVDYNQDGLLDVYLSTYESIMVRQYMNRRLRKNNSKAIPDSLPLQEYLSHEDAQQLFNLLYSKDWRPFTNHYGPPNVLLKNIGNGHFVIEKNSALSKVFRQTFQSTWADYDNDGDPDVYIANDFGPNLLFRNDGNGKFVDVTGETKTADIGFGMGASWGDYDNDGKQDVYITNMYSKAGLRITAQIPGLSPHLRQSARGNSLLRQDKGCFQRVSGLKPPALLVEEAGWSWGSQFIDIDNDGFLDIYAPCGHYTAPKEIAIPFDT
ncbi:MAG: VCBS repeat-containing protein [Calditrichaeota bacterium]|nr:MAG: VCBS repeat-containing protein [Calditrichota bacterium]